MILPEVAKGMPQGPVIIIRRNKMPKMKTHRSAAKRYKITASGKVLRQKAGKGHLLAHKSSARKNRLTGTTEVFEGNLKMISKELPYVKKSR